VRSHEKEKNWIVIMASDYPFGIFKLYLNKLFVFVLMVRTTIGTFVVYFGMFGMQWF
jgi:hypothetical protein